MKLTKEQQALISLVMAERGRKGGKKRWEGKTLEEKQLYSQRMNQAKAAKVDSQKSGWLDGAIGS
jgi:hypothetical protein